MKARHLGWFHPGSCPAALISTGDLDPSTFLDVSVRTAQPCQRGTYSKDNMCPHAKLELAARIAKHNLEAAERAAREKSSGDHALDAQRAMAEAVASAVAEQQKSSAMQMEALMALLKQHGINADEKASKHK